MTTLDQDLLAQVRGEEAVSGFEEWLQTLTVGLEAELDQLEAARKEALTRMKSIDSEITRVRKILRAVNPTEKPKPKKKSAASYSVADWRKEELLEAMRKHGGRKVTNRELAEILGWPRATVNTTTLVLRSEGKIRKAGDGPNKTQFYAIMPGVKSNV